MALVERMVGYLTWANSSIWGIVKNLSDEEFERTLSEGAGSIRRRYIHLAEDTWEWFHDWHGEEPREPSFQSMTRNQLYQFIDDYLGKWGSLIEERSVDEFADERKGKKVVISFEEMIFHLVNHFTYHRGQIVMGLKILGKDVPMTDYVPYRFFTL
ncbi:MAG: DinB family protein [Candidatus Thorarchaeota archaeon]